MKYFSLEILQGAQNGFLSTANHNNGALYVAAHEELAGDVLYNSTVAAMDRDGDPNWVHVVVESPEGRQLIRTRQLISAIPPKLENLRGFDLDNTERSLFGQFNNTYYYTVLARIDGLPPGTAILNRADNVPYGLPPMPAVYILNPTPVPGLFDILYGSEGFMSEEEVKEDMTQSVQRLQTGDLNAGAPEFVLYKVHRPFELTVPPDAIANGFYRELQGLQGRRRTLYTGAAFEAHDSSRIWRFTEALLQSMLQGQ